MNAFTHGAIILTLNFTFMDAILKSGSKVMIVCHCHALTDRAIRALVQDGASAREIRAACVAGSGCGNCCPLIDQITRSESKEPESRALELAPAP